ncbi:urate hydroxylase PuuD [Alphaproteobacteria bacterium LSUCC0684]
MIDLVMIWVEMLIRWLHVIAGVAWIGSSFYFIALDLSLKPGKGLPDEAHGEAWQVHGGGFYNMVKYLVAPKRMPSELTWFKWEAYATWLSGAALLVLIYYLGAELYLIDFEGIALEPWQAVALSFGGIIAGWAVYDMICRSPLGRNTGLLAGLVFVFLVVMGWGYHQLFAPRGAFMQMGVMMGTIMAANVLMVIIPGQRKVVANLIKGEDPDPEYGRRGKQRSLHNNYLTLPVVLVMIGGHYPMLYATDYAWVILGLVLVIGAVVRHFFNTKHKGDPAPWWTWGVAALLMALAIGLAMIGSPVMKKADEEAVISNDINEEAIALVVERCAICHAARPDWDGLAMPPKGVVLDHPEAIQRERRKVAEQAAWSEAMPPGGVISLTTAERQLLAAWYERQ